MYQPAPNAFPLRVLHVIPTLTGGGAENFLCALVAAMDPSIVRSGIMPVYPTQVPVDAALLRSTDIVPIDRSGRYDPGFLYRMVRGMRTYGPDIVHAHLHNGKYWGRLTALVARVPIVVFTEHSPQGDTLGLYETLVDRVVNRVTDGVITFTKHQRTILADREAVPLEKLTVIENGVPLPPLPDLRRRAAARAQLGAGNDEFTILVLGRLVPIKNTQLAIRAMHEVKAELRARIRLCIVGDGPEKMSLCALARSLGVQRHVAFYGYRADAVDLLYGADALYIPSLVEGMPLAALEAMTVGLPVITSPWPGAHDLLGEREFGIVLADWAARTAASVFQNAATDSRDLQQMGTRALRASRRRYDIRRAAREHERLYTELARRKGLR